MILTNAEIVALITNRVGKYIEFSMSLKAEEREKSPAAAQSILEAAQALVEATKK